MTLPQGAQWGWLVLMGMMGTLGQQLLTMGMKHEKAAVASSMRMADVVFAFACPSAFK